MRCLPDPVMYTCTALEMRCAGQGGVGHIISGSAWDDWHFNAAGAEASEKYDQIVALIKPINTV